MSALSVVKSKSKQVLGEFHGMAPSRGREAPSGVCLEGSLESRKGESSLRNTFPKETNVKEMILLLVFLLPYTVSRFTF